MPTMQIDEPQMDPKNQQTVQRHADIAAKLLLLLGKPGDFHSVQVRHLWGDHFRVNVLVGVDAASVKVAQSFFLEAGGDGTISAIHFRLNIEKVEDPDGGHRAVITLDGKYLPAKPF